MKKITNKGFSLIEGLLVVVIIGIVGFTGWYVRQSTQKTDKLNTQAAVDSQSANFSKKKQAQKYFVVEQWKVKMPMQDAGKVTYMFNGTCDDTLGFGKCDSFLTLSVKSGLYKVKNCDISAAIYRYTSIDQVASSSFKKVGNYYFTGGGGQYDCQNIHDNELNNKLRSEFDYTKLVAL